MVSPEPVGQILVRSSRPRTWAITASQSSVEKAFVTQPRQYIRNRVAMDERTRHAQVTARICDPRVSTMAALRRRGGNREGDRPTMGLYGENNRFRPWLQDESVAQTVPSTFRLPETGGGLYLRMKARPRALARKRERRSLTTTLDPTAQVMKGAMGSRAPDGISGPKNPHHDDQKPLYLRPDRWVFSPAWRFEYTVWPANSWTRRVAIASALGRRAGPKLRNSPRRPTHPAPS